MENLKENLERHTVVLSENMELRREEFGLKTENEGLKKENSRQDMLLFYYTPEKGAEVPGGAARGSAFNALQRVAVAIRRSGGHVALNFEQRVADAVAKAGLRTKPGPKQGGIQNRFPKKSGRGKANHSEWNSQENPKSRRKSNFSNAAPEKA